MLTKLPERSRHRLFRMFYLYVPSIYLFKQWLSLFTYYAARGAPSFGNEKNRKKEQEKTNAHVSRSMELYN
jgi:hypothetical protein